MANNTPAFQYYPADLISDPEVMFWDMEALGCYWQMITYLWLNGGKFEYNIENLCKLFRKNHKKTSIKLWKKIEKKFIIEDGIVTHKRINSEIQRQAESRLRRQEAGKKGADKRWADDSNAISKSMAKNSSSTSTSTSTSVNKRGATKFCPPSVTDVLAYVQENNYKINPQAFCDFYASKGWMVGKNKMKDWKAAVRTWHAKDNPAKATKEKCYFCKQVKSLEVLKKTTAVGITVPVHICESCITEGRHRR